MVFPNPKEAIGVPAAARLSQFFNRKGIDCQCLHHDRVESLQAAVLAADIPPQSVVRATLLIDVKGVVMAVHGLQASLDLGAVNRIMGRRLQPLAAHQADRLFGDCDPGEHPPIGEAYGLPVVVDNSLLSAQRLFMASGCKSALIELDGRAFRLALAGAARGAIAIHMEEQEVYPDRTQELTLDDVARKLQRLYRLPPMPAVALHILRTTGDPDSSARELAHLIERDPSLAAQVIRYARSALFNYQGQIDSVQDAITRVLGFERVAHIAMGLAASRAFQVPHEGPLGLDAFWRHSLHCAYLTQRIADTATAGEPMNRGLAYLCGLLHNFGLLLIAHLFPPEFRLLSKLREASPDQPLALLEKQVFGMGGAQDLIAVGHGAIGGILAKLWELPETLVKVAGMHQHPGYDGVQANYVNAVQLANALLKRQGIGDEFDDQDIAPFMIKLGLGDEALDELARATEEAADELDALASSLAA
jgi:HD-like signal output (HDOD) protein/prolyl-tRNA editing enzyme YbaK/EbsC (Cys-tRNA(Pro) deacylase)